jgi:hypothetical protein
MTAAMYCTSDTPYTQHTLLCCVLYTGISAGLLFAVATGELIPEAMSVQVEATHHDASVANGPAHDVDAQHSHQTPEHSHSTRYASFGIAIGFFALLVLEHVMTSLGAQHSHSHSHSSHHSDVPLSVVPSASNSNQKPNVDAPSTFGIVAFVGLAGWFDHSTTYQHHAML